MGEENKKKAEGRYFVRIHFVDTTSKRQLYIMGSLQLAMLLLSSRAL